MIALIRLALYSHTVINRYVWNEYFYMHKYTGNNEDEDDDDKSNSNNNNHNLKCIINKFYIIS